MNAPSTNGTGRHKRPLKERLERERMRRELAQERVSRRMLESCSYYSEDGRQRIAPRSVAEPPAPGERVIVHGQGEGRKAPFSNLDELTAIRDASRYLADENLYTCGMLGALESYVVGTGFSYRVVAKERRVVDSAWLVKGQDVVDEFIDRMHWWDWEREAFRRLHRDGDEPRRYFPKGDKLIYRPVEPEHVVDPPGIMPDDPEWSMGVRRAEYDPYTVVSYWVSYDGDPAHGKEVPAGEIDWHKANVDQCIPRGIPDFFAVRDIAPDLLKLISNVVRGAQVLAAIAWIESQAPGVLRSEVEAMALGAADYTQTNPSNNATEYYQRMKPGSKISTNAGKQYNPAPLAANTMNFVEIVRLCRQAFGQRWSASEILTGDASNGNYSSLVVAESPFVHRMQTEQYAQANGHRMTMLRALRLAEAAGKLPHGFCDNIDVQVEPPPITGRKPAEEAAADEIEQRLGIVSPQTQADRRGYNWEREQEQIRKAKAMGWVPAGAAPLAGPVAMQARESAGDPFWWLRSEVPEHAERLEPVQEKVVAPPEPPKPTEVVIHQTIHQPERDPVKRTIRKTIERDAEGRPLAIVETET